MRSVLALVILGWVGPLAAQTCASSTNVSNFNGTPIAGGSFIWFNANFTAVISGKDGDGGWDVIATMNRNNVGSNCCRESPF